MKGVSVNIEDVRFAFIRKESVNVRLVNHILDIVLQPSDFNAWICMAAMIHAHTSCGIKGLGTGLFELYLGV